MPGVEQCDGLIDHVQFIAFDFLVEAALDHLDDPARVEVDTEADSAAMLAEVLDGVISSKE